MQEYSTHVFECYDKYQKLAFRLNSNRCVKDYELFEVCAVVLLI